VTETPFESFFVQIASSRFFAAVFAAALPDFAA
jgi:hypothetical protein